MKLLHLPRQQPSPAVIADLRELLALAESGDLEYVAYVAIQPGGEAAKPTGDAGNLISGVLPLRTTLGADELGHVFKRQHRPTWSKRWRSRRRGADIHDRVGGPDLRRRL